MISFLAFHFSLGFIASFQVALTPTLLLLLLVWDLRAKLWFTIKLLHKLPLHLKMTLLILCFVILKVSTWLHLLQILRLIQHLLYLHFSHTSLHIQPIRRTHLLLFQPRSQRLLLLMYHRWWRMRRPQSRKFQQSGPLKKCFVTCNSKTTCCIIP